MSLPQKALAGLLIIGFLGLVAVTATTGQCAGGVSIADVVQIYGCR